MRISFKLGNGSWEVLTIKDCNSDQPLNGLDQDLSMDLTRTYQCRISVSQYRISRPSRFVYPPSAIRITGSANNGSMLVDTNNHGPETRTYNYHSSRQFPALMPISSVYPRPHSALVPTIHRSSLLHLRFLDSGVFYDAANSYGFFSVTTTSLARTRSHL
ncbi:hypothetical protein CPB85DRAFT_740585 [Mucidula mucida]|nr:hypothetical protein CPB85DRAFT_740585 [Mucidula mucida]